MKINAKASLHWRALSASALCLLLILNGALVAAMKPQAARNRPKTIATERASGVAPASIGDVSRPRIKDAFGKLPLRFEENRGQTDSKTKFISRGPGYTFFLSQTEAVLKLIKSQARQEFTSPVLARRDYDSEMVRAMPPLSEKHRAGLPRPDVKSDEPSSQSAVLRMRLTNANPAPRVSGRDELPDRASYYIGSNPKNWSSRARNFEKVEYKDVYPGIDLIYYGNQGQLEYDFNVAPGADPRSITLSFNGADGITIDRQGSLIIRVGQDEIRQHKPVVYQELLGIRRPISGHYLLKGDSKVGFQVDNYDPTIALVIDPVVSFGTYLGGSGTDSMFGLAADAAGNVYTAGFTTSLDYPTVNASQPAYGGGTTDVVVSKLSPDLSQLLFSTYIGGSGDDRAIGLDVDQSGNAYVTGFTASPNFPTINAMQATFSGIRDIFALKLDPAGALVYSTYIGRNGDDRGQASAVDGSGNVAIVGLTSSTTFPMVNAFQPTFGGSPADVFVLKLNAAGSALLYSSYLGGSASAQPVFGELVNGIRLDSAGNIYLTGFTEANNFPTKNALQSNFGGGTRDVFLAKVDPSKSGADSLVYSTYLGGSNRDEGNAVTVDTSGNAYLTGFTFSTNFPTANAEQATLAGGADMFVTKVNPTGRALVYSTYLGGTNNEQGTDIEVDQQGRAFVAGGSTSSNFPKAVPLRAAGEVSAAADGFGAEFCAGGYFKLDLNDISLSRVSIANTNVNAVDRRGTISYLAADDRGLMLVDGQTVTEIFKTNLNELAVDVVARSLPRPGALYGFDGRSGAVLFCTPGGCQDSSAGLPPGTSVSRLAGGLEGPAGMIAKDRNFYFFDFDNTWKRANTPDSGFPSSAWVKDATPNPNDPNSFIVAVGADNPADRGLGTFKLGARITYEKTGLTGVDVDAVHASGSNIVAAAVLNNKVRLSHSVNFGLDFNTFDTDVTASAVSKVWVDPTGNWAFSSTDRGFVRTNLIGRQSDSLPPLGIGPTDFFVNQLTNTIDVATRFFEYVILVYLDTLGGQLAASCFGLDGTSFGARLQFARVIGGFFRWAGFVTAARNGPAATRFQSNNRGSFNTFIAGLDFSPRINRVTKSGRKKLIVEGNDFDEGAKILVNDARQKTFNDETSPTTTLIGKKAGKKIRDGDIVEVENADGRRSNKLRFSF